MCMVWFPVSIQEKGCTGDPLLMKAKAWHGTLLKLWHVWASFSPGTSIKCSQYSTSPVTVSKLERYWEVKWPSAIPQHHVHPMYLCTQVASCSFQNQIMIIYHNPFVRWSVPHLLMDSAYNQPTFDNSSSRKTQTAPYCRRHQVHKSRSQRFAD